VNNWFFDKYPGLKNFLDYKVNQPVPKNGTPETHELAESVKMDKSFFSGVRENAIGMQRQLGNLYSDVVGKYRQNITKSNISSSEGPLTEERQAELRAEIEGAWKEAMNDYMKRAITLEEVMIIDVSQSLRVRGYDFSAGSGEPVKIETPVFYGPKQFKEKKGEPAKVCRPKTLNSKLATSKV